MKGTTCVCSDVYCTCTTRLPAAWSEFSEAGAGRGEPLHVHFIHWRDLLWRGRLFRPLPDFQATVPSRPVGHHNSTTPPPPPRPRTAQGIVTRIDKEIYEIINSYILLWFIVTRSLYIIYLMWPLDGQCTFLTNYTNICTFPIGFLVRTIISSKYFIKLK
jgi:hypothetical protein